MQKLNADKVRKSMRSHLALFIEAAFIELNPSTDFLHNWHIDLLAQELEDCFTGKTKRLIINIPPRSLKSHCVSVAFVAWLLGRRPSAQVICASYAQDLSDKHARDCRLLMDSDLYRDTFETRLSNVKASVGEFMTTQGGTRLSTSTGGAMTGRGGDWIIIDDPQKPDTALSEAIRKTTNEWFSNTVLSRLNDKREGCIIVVMQRLHEDDLSGHLLQNPDWRLVRLPAIAAEAETYEVNHPLAGTRMIHRKEGEALHPERESLEVLAEIRRSMGEYDFAGQYQQSPAPKDGGLVKISWFKTYSAVDKPSKFDFIFQSWDSANTANELSDYSACTTWGVLGQKIFLLHVLRKRLEYPELKKMVLQQAAAFKARHILIEDKASGTQLLQELRRAGMHGVTAYKSDLHKVVRMNTVTSTLENGFVYIPDAADWLNDYLHEMSVFPNGRHDDQVDATSQALDWMKSRYFYSGVFEFYQRCLEADGQTRIEIYK